MITATLPEEAIPSRRKVSCVSIVFALVAVLAVSLGLGLGLRRNESQNDNAMVKSKSTDGSGNGASKSVRVPTSNPMLNPSPNSKPYLMPYPTPNPTRYPTPNPTWYRYPTPYPTPNPTFDPTTSLIGNEDPITFTSRLTTITNVTIKQAYDSCDSLTADLLILAQQIANKTIEGYSYYFGESSNYYYNDDDGISTAAAVTNTGNKTKETTGNNTEGGSNTRAGSTKKSVSESSFGTNNQVNGVEEGDLVQSNGEQVFVIYGREIIELTVDRVTVASRSEIPVRSINCSDGLVVSMFLMDDRLTVVDTSYCDETVTGTTTTTYYDYGYEQNTIDVYVYDVSDMSLVKTWNMNGTFVSARAVGDNIHIVSTTDINIYALTRDLEPWGEDIYSANMTFAQYRVKAQEVLNERVQAFVDTIIQGTDCTSFQKLALFQNVDEDLDFSSMLDSILAVTSITTKSDSMAISVSNVMVPSSEYIVYASADYLILAVEGWFVDENAAEATYLISYKLDGQSSNATSIGIVPGYVLNQFSIDHVIHDGEDYLRVASTTTSLWDYDSNGNWVEIVNTTSQVTVLKLDDDASTMTVVGTVGNLGKNDETIYSVRFVGDQGFVTTFEVIDPFYTLDLSDPSNPTKAGELEVPGFSTYLHPVGNNLIIAVGQATTSSGSEIGVQVSLFDVSNFSNPIRIQNFTDIGNANVSFGSYSEVEYDFDAFRYLNDSQLLIIPITLYNTYTCLTDDDDGTLPSDDTVADSLMVTCDEIIDGYDGFRVYEVKTDGIKLYMSIRHDESDWDTSCYSSAVLPPRSLVFDGDLMTMKSHSILSHDLSTLETNVSSINLDNQTTECESYYTYY